MSGAKDPSSQPERDSFEDVLAGYLIAVQAGEQPDQQQLIAAHPEWAEALRIFFQDDDRIRGLLAMPPAVIDADPVPAACSDARLMPTTPLNSAGSDAGARLLGRFGDYDLLEQIEQGGMGVVYRAWQVSLDRIVALKVIKSGQLAGPQEIRRFHIEAEAAAHLHHVGIVPVYEVGEIDGLHYYTMEFVVGRSLATCLAEGPIPPSHAAALLMKIARAVAYAHTRGVIHRDLKPANILLDVEGEPKITDFGLAKRLRSDAGLTATGQILGTPAFMAPEQAAGRDRRVSPATDIYALGALLYAMLTGRAPHVASNEIDVLLKVLDSDPVPPRRLQSGVSRSLEQICLCCLEKDPQRRYPSAGALADDLQRFLRDEPLELPSCSVVQRLQRWARREPALVTHLAAILSFLVMLAIVYYWRGSEPYYYLRHFSALASWFGLSIALQKLLDQPRWSNGARFLWASVDVLLLTVILYMAHPPRGPLLIGYPVLIVASSMFARTRLVWFTTALTMVGYLVLIATRSEELVKPHFCVFYTMALVVIGCLAAAQVRRIRALTRYYEGSPQPPGSSG